MTGSAPIIKRSRSTAAMPASFEAWARTLESAGLSFRPESRRWQLLQASKHTAIKPLNLGGLDVLFRRSRIEVEEVTFILNLQRWGKTLQNAARETWGSRTRAELHKAPGDELDARFWIVIEFSRPGSSEQIKGYSRLFDHSRLPAGIVVMGVALAPAQDGMHISNCGLCTMGYLPPNVWQRIPFFLRRSFQLPGTPRIVAGDQDGNFLSQLVATSELTGSIDSEASQALQNALTPQLGKIDSFMARRATQAWMDPSGNLSWRIRPATGPVSTSADTELTSAQQLLAGLITDPEKRASQTQALQSARAKWLDDPVVCLLDASLALAIAQDSADPEGILVAISTLVRKLHETWPGVDASPVATTILSELIGDAWAGLPEKAGSFDRAKAAWSKAAATRAHPLRILKKIAATARLRGMIEEEAFALEQIVQQEKRRKELASALVRLAAIVENDNSALRSHRNRTPAQLLELAASTAPDEPMVLEAMFRHLIDSGATAKAITTGKELLAAYRDAGEQEKIADIALAMGRMELANGEMEGASRLFGEAHQAVPLWAGPLTELARIAALREDRGTQRGYLEKAIATLLNSPEGNRETLHMLHESTVDCLELPGPLPAAQSQLILAALQRCLQSDGHALLLEFSVRWHRVIQKIAFEPVQQALKMEAGKILLILTRRQDAAKTSPVSTPAVAAHLAAQYEAHSIVLAMDLIALACRLASPDSDNPFGAQRLGGQIEPLLKKVIKDQDSIPGALAWLEKNLKAAVNHLGPLDALALLLEALHVPGGLDPARSMQDGGWLTEAIKSAISRWNNSPEETGGSHETNGVLHLKLGLELLRQSANSGTVDDTAAIAFWLVGENPSITILIAKGMEPGRHAHSRLTGKNFSSVSLLTRMLSMSGDPQWIDVISARIFALLREDEGNRSAETAVALEDAVSDAAQRRQLKGQELNFLVERAKHQMKEKTFAGLLDQATFVENEGTSAQLFKFCLDHALLRARDEGMAGKVLTFWLSRLQGASPGRNVDRKAERKEATLSQLAAELLRLQSELGLPSHGDQEGSLRENLAKAGLVPPENPAHELMEAAKDQDTARLDRTLKALDTQAPGILDETIRLLFASLRQQRVPLVTPAEAITALLATPTLGELMSRASQAQLPVQDHWFEAAITLALLAADHLQDRGRALRVLKDLAAAHPDERRLWIPLYLLIGERDEPGTMIQHLECILPALRENQDVLVDYPFTVESLEAELARLKLAIPAQPDVLVSIEPEAPELELDTPAEAAQAEVVVAPVSEVELPQPEPKPEPEPGLRLEPESDQPDHADSGALQGDQGIPEAAPTVEAEEPFTATTPETPPDMLEVVAAGNLAPAAEPVHLPVPEPEPAPKIGPELGPLPAPEFGPAPVPALGPAPAPASVTEPVPASVTESAPQLAAAPEPPRDTKLPPAPPPVADNLIDWRRVIRDRKAPPGFVQEILDKPFSSKLEKHLALQAIAIMRGEVHLLERWDWRVWRKAHEYGYERSGKKRFPAGLSPRVMKSPEFKLLLRTGPVLARAFKERFTIAGLARSLKMSPRQIMEKRQRLDWATGLAGYAGFNHHANSLRQSGLQLFSMPGLGPQIFFEVGQKTIYVDDAYFSRKPPSHLYHRIMFVLYAMRIGFYFLINLSAEQHIQPELDKVRSLFKKGGLAVLAAKAKLTDCKLAKAMAPADFYEIAMLFDRCGPISVDDINDISKAMQQYIWRMMLADSVNLVGILEAMLDIDMALPGSIKENEVLLMSPQVDPLLNFALAMDLRTQATG